MTIEKVIETSASMIFIEDRVLHIVFKKDAEVDLNDINEIIEARNEILEKHKILVLVDIRALWQANKEARERSASDDMLGRAAAMAILSNSLPTRLLANFYMRFVSDKLPVRMFKEKAQALEWLHKFE